ncbi:hypothetical protein J2W79_004435 [Methylorubrum extorquens]|nr:hypothetical protein [Methylorubrum extorquens]
MRGDPETEAVMGGLPCIRFAFSPPGRQDRHPGPVPIRWMRVPRPLVLVRKRDWHAQGGGFRTIRRPPIFESSSPHGARPIEIEPVRGLGTVPRLSTSLACPCPSVKCLQRKPAGRSPGLIAAGRQSRMDRFSLGAIQPEYGPKAQPSRRSPRPLMAAGRDRRRGR